MSGDPHFTPIDFRSRGLQLPDHLLLMDGHNPHPVSIMAADDLQSRLLANNIDHNFGLDNQHDGAVIGKMFGVLVVITSDGETGYLSAFSGKMAGGNHHTGFVPPVFDSLTEDSFLNQGMQELGRINTEIRELESAMGSSDNSLSPEDRALTQLKDVNRETLALLRMKRKRHSTTLQQQLFSHYYFRNQKGTSKSLNEIFSDAGYKNPPSGAGECAGPKLLQYAFEHNLRPLALTEFWWGESPKSAYWKHKEFYPCCKEKCEPILGFMLSI